jgi:DNA-binding beta-propeller fold protein YncE
MSTRARWTGIALLVALGAACGGGSRAPDTVVPIVKILFPPAPAPALATTAMLTITGTASDDRRIAGVVVNGVDATSGDGFATWRAQVTLAPGVTAVSVEARDTSGNTAAAAVDVTRVAAVLAAPGGIAFDAPRGQAFLVDRAQGALFAVDAATGAPSVVSDALDAPQGLVLDAANDRALVVDSGLGALLAVDLDTGAASVLSDAATGGGPALPSPRAVDADADNAWVVDNVLRQLVRIDLATGDRTVVAVGLANPQGVRLDPDGGAALVADGARLVRVDLATGDITELTGMGPAFGNAMGLVVDAPNRRAFVADALLAAVLAVDLDTGERTVVADTDLAFPAAVAFDAAAGRVLVADTVRDAALAVDAATGAVAALWESSFGAGAPLASPRDVALDGDRALVADFARGLVAVATDRAALDGGGPDFQVPLGVAVDAVGGRALVADSAAAALFAVDLATGARTIVADGFAGPIGVAHDAARDMAYVLDGAVFLDVDLATGDRAPLPAGSGPVLVVPRGFALDAAHGRLLVVDDGLDALLAVDLATGARSEIVGGFAVPADVALDAAGRAFVVDTDVDGIVVVDLATGVRTEVAGAGPPLLSPVAVAYDGRLLVLDAALSALLAVDPETGERVVLSK